MRGRKSDESKKSKMEKVFGIKINIKSERGKERDRDISRL